jgi:hypothetical protein
VASPQSDTSTPVTFWDPRLSDDSVYAAAGCHIFPVAPDILPDLSDASWQNLPVIHPKRCKFRAIQTQNHPIGA